MKTMKQVVLRQYGLAESLKVEEVSIPKPKKGEVLVQVSASGVNFADIMRRTNRYLEPSELPLVLGSEIAGTVYELGEGTSRFRQGDRVLGFVGTGGYSQYVTVNENLLIPLVDQIEFPEATALLVQGLTAYLMTTDITVVKDKTIFIESSAGGVGSILIQIAKHQGAKLIIGSSSSVEKRELSKSLGADIVVDSLGASLSKTILEATGGKGVDVCYEMSGGKTFPELLNSLSDFGTLITFGRASGEETNFDPSRILSPNQTIRGFYLGGYFKPSHQHLIQKATQALINLVVSKKVIIQLGNAYPLEKAYLAHRDIENRKTSGKVFLKPF